MFAAFAAVIAVVVQWLVVAGNSFAFIYMLLLSIVFFLA